MVSTLGTRPNHYQMLGIEPSATAEEITRAFAREMSMFRPRAMGGAAEVAIAYETLRDPAKRRAYDESLRPRPEPEPVPKPKEWAPFMIRASAHPAERPAVDPLHRSARPPEPQPQLQPRADSPVDPRLAAIAASLRELAKPGAFGGSAEPAPQPEAARPPASDTKPAIEPQAEELRFGEVELGAVDWKRTGIAIGGAILGVGLLGGLLGTWSGSAVDEPQQAEGATTVALPPAKARAVAAALSPAPGGAEAAPPTRAVAAHGAQRVAKALPQRALSDGELEELLPVDVSSRTNEDAPDATMQAIAEGPAVAPTPARMPLSDATIARTIGRIGYSCGRVSSVVEGEGTGVYTVTCTSGQSYRAAPVRGRYHFRRLSRR